jgi:hypothetical protein
MPKSFLQALTVAVSNLYLNKISVNKYRKTGMSTFHRNSVTVIYVEPDTVG